MYDTFDSPESSTSMPQSNNPTEQRSETEDGSSWPEITSSRYHTNVLAAVNPQDSNEEELSDYPVSYIAEADPNFICPGHRHSSPLRHRVSPWELIDLGPIFTKRRVIPVTFHRQQIDGNPHHTLDYATAKEFIIMRSMAYCCFLFGYALVQ